MKRLFNHLLQILILGAIFLVMIKLPLFKIPFIQEILTGLIFLLIIAFIVVCMYKKKKTFKSILILLFLFTFISNSVFAWTQEEIAAMSGGRYTGTPKTQEKSSIKTTPQEEMGLDRSSRYGVTREDFGLATGQFCGLAEDYDRKTFNAKQNNWVGDEPCQENVYNAVRDKLNKLKISPSVFKARDKLTSQQMKTYRSFRQDSHWNDWVNQKFTESAQAAGADPEELACAAKLESLCSEYERRHPTPTSLTVTQIMRSDAETVGCWPCKMSYIILTVIQDLSSDLESKMQDAALRILSIFFLLWILYTTFLAVVFPSKATNFLKDFMTRLLCVLIAAMILVSGDNLKALYKNVLTPVIGLGLGLTQQIGQAINVDTTFATEVNSQVGITSIGEDYCTDISSTTVLARLLFDPGYRSSEAFLDNSTNEDSLLTPELQVALLCMTQTMYRQVSPITAVGQSLIGFAQTESKIPAKIGSISFGFSFPNLIMWSVGFVLVVLFTVFGFLVAFKIIDIFLRLGFVLVLMPLFVATWAFPATRDFTKKGFMFLMSIITEFLGLVLAINFIIVMSETGVANNRADLIAKMVAPYSKKYGENLLNVILSNGGWYFFFMIIALAFMGFKLLSVSTKIIASLFDGDIAKSASLGGDITGAVAVSAVQMGGKLFKKGHEVSNKVKKYEAPESTDHQGDRSSSAASKRYFSQQAGNSVKRGSQHLAAGIDKVGVGLGQALNKTGIGAIVGVPLTLGAKTLSLGIRATGRVASGTIKTTGAVAHGVRHPVQTSKNAWNATKAGVKNTWNKVTSGPKKVLGEIKRGFNRGDGK